MTIIKAYLLYDANSDQRSDTEIRRFEFDVPKIHPFEAFATQIRTLFPALSGKAFILSWKDDQDDTIVMSSDVELLEALRNVDVSTNMFRVYITLSPPKQGQARIDSSSGQIHPGVTCDVCDSNVRGVRYKCLQCEDYDMCEQCYDKKIHAEHDMLMLVNPNAWPNWSLPGSRRFWKHCSRPAGGKGHHHHGWGSRRGVARGAEEASAEDAGAPPQAGTPQGDAFTAGRAQYHELLNGIGDTIANLLDPLGINVAYHVDTAARTQTGSEQTQTEDTGPASTEEKDRAVGADSQARAAEPMDTTSSPATVPAATLTAASAAPPAPIQKEAPAASLYPNVEEHPDTLGWTVLNQEERQDRTSVPPAELGESSGTAVDAALHQMLSMGFTNEGGWLRKLLTVKDGNIEAVLESLNPTGR